MLNFFPPSSCVGRGLQVRPIPARMHRVLTILKAALNHAHHEAKCASDDGWRTVRAFREADAAQLRYLSDAEARRLANACPPRFPRFALVTAALLTGCRYGELTVVTVDDFNPDAGTLRVRASKSRKPLHVVLTRVRGRPCHWETWQRSSADAEQRAGVGQIRAAASPRHRVCRRSDRSAGKFSGCATPMPAGSR
jgi:integrase